uniref:Uncharacterized protein n=1 Tax=Macrostomum lignano TaxID=282301 RepID=A0A1I8FLA3_9PLAT
MSWLEARHRRRTGKGVVIALLVIVSILLLIACAIFALAERENEMILGEAITFTGGHDHDGAAAGFLLYLNSSNGNLMRAKFYNSNNTAAVETLLNKDRFSEGKILEFSASADCTAVLIPVAKEQMRPVRITDNLGDPGVSFGCADCCTKKRCCSRTTGICDRASNLTWPTLQFNDTSVPLLQSPLVRVIQARLYLQSRLIRLPASGNASRTTGHHIVDLTTIKGLRRIYSGISVDQQDDGWSSAICCQHSETGRVLICACHYHAGPTAQLATRQFTLGWPSTTWPAALFVISVSVDARGTRNRGSKFLFDIPRRRICLGRTGRPDGLARTASPASVRQQVLHSGHRLGTTEPA